MYNSVIPTCITTLFTQCDGPRPMAVISRKNDQIFLQLPDGHGCQRKIWNITAYFKGRAPPVPDDIRRYKQDFEKACNKIGNLLECESRRERQITEDEKRIINPYKNPCCMNEVLFDCKPPVYEDIRLLFPFLNDTTHQEIYHQHVLMQSIPYMKDLRDFEQFSSGNAYTIRERVLGEEKTEDEFWQDEEYLRYCDRIRRTHQLNAPAGAGGGGGEG